MIERGMHRDRRLLDLAHEAPCMLRLGTPCGTNPSVPCHSDMLRHGRGAGHKSHDCLAVPGCPNCHSRFTREALGRDGYERVWQLANEEYQGWLWRNEKVRFA